MGASLVGGGAGVTVNVDRTIAAGTHIENEPVIKSDGAGEMMQWQPSDGGADGVFIIQDASTGSAELGIGITPTAPLSVYSTTPSKISLQNNSSGTGAGNGIEFYMSGLNAGIHNYEAGALNFATSNTNRLTISSAGNVGIATSSARAIVDFGPGSGDGTLSQTISEYQSVYEAPQGTGDIGRNIGFAVTTGGIVAAINTVDNGGSGQTGLTFNTGTAGAITERMRINSDGDVSIGSTSSASGGQLHVDDASGAIIGLSRTTGAATQNLGQIRFGNTNVDSNLASIAAVQDGGSDNSRLEFRTQASGSEATTRMSISSSGVVSIPSGSITLGSLDIGHGLGGDSTCTAVGTDALDASLSTSLHNTAIGNNALTALNHADGDENTAVGSLALAALTAGSGAGYSNTAVGAGSLGVTVDGMKNTAVGEDALGDGDCGNENTAVGNDTNVYFIFGCSKYSKRINYTWFTRHRTRFRR